MPNFGRFRSSLACASATKSFWGIEHSESSNVRVKCSGRKLWLIHEDEKPIKLSSIANRRHFKTFDDLVGTLQSYVEHSRSSDVKVHKKRAPQLAGGSLPFQNVRRSPCASGVKVVFPIASSMVLFDQIHHVVRTWWDSMSRSSRGYTCKRKIRINSVEVSCAST